MSKSSTRRKGLNLRLHFSVPIFSERIHVWIWSYCLNRGRFRVLVIISATGIRQLLQRQSEMPHGQKKRAAWLLPSCFLLNNQPFLWPLGVFCLIMTKFAVSTDMIPSNEIKQTSYLIHLTDLYFKVNISEKILFFSQQQLKYCTFSCQFFWPQERGWLKLSHHHSKDI